MRGWRAVDTPWKSPAQLYVTRWRVRMRGANEERRALETQAMAAGAFVQIKMGSIRLTEFLRDLVDGLPFRNVGAPGDVKGIMVYAPARVTIYPSVPELEGRFDVQWKVRRC